MKQDFIACKDAVEESNRQLNESDKTLQKELDSTIELDENLEVVESDSGITVTRSFMGAPVIEFQQETTNNSSVEYRGSILFKGKNGIGSITSDNKRYVGLMDATTLTPYLAGVYTIDGEDILHLSTGIDYGVLTVKPVKKSRDEVFDFLKKAVEKGYLEEAVLHFLENPASLLEATARHVKNATLQFDDVALFNQNEYIVMFEEKDYNYDTEQVEPQQRFNVVQADGAETVFKNLKANELNELVTILNQHYMQSKQILYPLSMVIRNSGTLDNVQETGESYYVSASELKDLRNAEYFQYSINHGLKKVDVKISGYISGHKYKEFFENSEGLLEVAGKVNKWVEPIMCICLDNKEIGFKILGNKTGVSIKTEVKEMKYLFE